MNAPKPSFAQRISAREPMLGTLLRMPSEGLVEMTALVGMDFVVIDTEHGPSDQIPLTAHLLAAAAAGIPALVRVGDIREILRVLDLGAAGIIAPHISSVAAAQEVLTAALYPPHGERGFATYTRSGHHGLIGVVQHLENARTNTVIVLMIEDGAGVLAAQDIAALPGVDALFVGPADLSVGLGLPGQQGSAQVRAAIASVHQGAHRGGAAVLSIASDPATARDHFAAGSDMVVYNVLSALGGLFSSLASGRIETDVASSRPHTRARSSSGLLDPVVLLPGMLATPAVWQEFTGHLDAGRSARPSRIDLDDSIAGMAASVLAQAPQRFVLVGHSLGGVVALEIIRSAPERVSALVLLGCSGRLPSAEQLDSWGELAARTGSGGFGEVVAEQARINTGGAAAQHAASCEKMAHQLGADGFLRQLTAQCGRVNNLEWLHQINVPTLIISGELDAVARPELQQELAQAIPAARWLTVAGVGHMALLSHPAELAALVNDFLLDSSAQAEPAAQILG